LPSGESAKSWKSRHDILTDPNICLQSPFVNSALYIESVFVFKENVSIKKLDLSWNGFSNDGCRLLSKVLIENRVLKDLDLSSNRITLEGVKYLCKGLLKNENLVKLQVINH
jgi:Ran GTPase-activating protein (RanGAP) involved in mRNA processing and transport